MHRMLSRRVITWINYFSPQRPTKKSEKTPIYFLQAKQQTLPRHPKHKPEHLYNWEFKAYAEVVGKDKIDLQVRFCLGSRWPSGRALPTPITAMVVDLGWGKNCSRGRRPSMPMTVREEEAGAPLPLQSGCSPATTLTVLIVPRNQPSSGPLPSRRRPCHHIFPAAAALPVLAQPRRHNAAWHPLERPRRPNQNHHRRVARGAAGARRTGEPWPSARRMGHGVGMCTKGNRGDRHRALHSASIPSRVPRA
jgi:hypothetical protein